MIKGGYFITFEGIEGVGKSTQLQLAHAALREQHGDAIVLTREPGGTAAGEVIREWLLQDHASEISAMTELLLIFAARAQHVKECICPALAEDRIVLCDRFTDATYAYQGAARGLGRQAVAALEKLVQAGLQPHLTIVLDMPVPLALQRVRTRQIKHPGQDRFEAEQQTFFQQVRQAYLTLADEQLDRVHVIAADRDIDTVGADIKALFQRLGLLA